MNYRTAILVVCILCIVAPQLAVAAESEDLHPFLERGFSLDLGSFFPIENWICGKRSVAGINEEIDFDEGIRLGNADETFAAECPGDFAASGRSLVNTSNLRTASGRYLKRISNGETSFSGRAAMQQQALIFTNTNFLRTAARYQQIP